MFFTSRRINQNARFFLPLFAISLIGYSSTALAAESGRVTLDGREIILFDDNTWRYSSKAGGSQTVDDTTDCVKLESKTIPLSICLDEDVWKLDTSDGPAEFSFTTKNDDMYLMMITEGVEIPLKAYEKAIVSNAQSAAGLKPVKVVSTERINAHGIQWGRMIYVVDINGLIIKYENFFTSIKGKGSVQFVFYTTPGNYDAARAEIEKAKEHIRLE